MRLDNRYAHRRIFRETTVSRDTIRRIGLRLGTHGDPYPPIGYHIKRGPEPYLPEMHKEALHEFAISQKTSYLDEMRDFFYNKYYVKQAYGQCGESSTKAILHTR